MEQNGRVLAKSSSGGEREGTFVKEEEFADIYIRGKLQSYVDSTRFGSWKRAVVCGRFSMASELGGNRAGVTE